MTHAYDALVLDLISRTEREAERVVRLATDTGITFSGEDIADAVERGLPEDYPAPTRGDMTRRDVIVDMACAILSGDLYKNA